MIKSEIEEAERDLEWDRQFWDKELQRREDTLKKEQEELRKDQKEFDKRSKKWEQEWDKKFEEMCAERNRYIDAACQLEQMIHDGEVGHPIMCLYQNTCRDCREQKLMWKVAPWAPKVKRGVGRPKGSVNKAPKPIYRRKGQARKFLCWYTLYSI